MNEKYAAAFAERARAYWTDERTEQLTGGKDLTILPREGAMLLRALGLLHRDASMPPAQVRKYRQINHMVAVLGPSLRELIEEHDEIHIFDAGCGRSYLTVLLAWAFVHRYEHPVRILGVDRNADLIEECRRRTSLVGLEDVLRYEPADLDEVSPTAAWHRAFGDGADPRIDAVISLHACDTATDAAIALGLAVDAHMIAVAPCCQAELSAKWKTLHDKRVPGPFAPIRASNHLRRETAATVTDALRMLLMRSAGRMTSAIEFVAPEHTPKNTLIRAMRRGNLDEDAVREYLALKKATGGASIALEGQLPPRLKDALTALG